MAEYRTVQKNKQVRQHQDAYKDVFGALAHPARRRVLLAIFFNGGAMTAGEVAAIFEHAWQTTTRHLQVLEAAGLLTHERQGRMRIYRLERKRLKLVTDWLDHFQEPTKQSKGGKQHGLNLAASGHASGSTKVRIA